MSVYRVLYLNLSLISILSCHSDIKEIESSGNQIPFGDTPTIVRTALATRIPFEYIIEGSGKLEATQQIKIPIKTKGYIADLPIRNGQWVSKGSLLARLDSQEAQLALRKALIELKERQLDYENNLLGFAYNKQDSEYEKIKENVRYGSGLKKAELSLEEAQLQLANTRIIAPLSGVIANLATVKFESVLAGSTLCTVYAPGSLVLNMKVLEGNFAQLRTGISAIVHPVALPEQSFPAKVTEINPIVNQNGMLQVKLKLLKFRNLLPGMRATAIIMAPADTCLVVPKEAIVTRSGREVVFTVEEGLAKWNYVTTGLENNTSVQILEGLKPNYQVIIDNNIQLTHGAPIQVMNLQ